MADVAAAAKAGAAQAPRRAMTRLRAERVVAAAQRLSADGAASTDATGSPKPPGGSFATGALRPLVTAAAPSTTTPTTTTTTFVAPDVYLQQSGVQFLLEDLIKRLQLERPEAPAAFIANYWASVAAGTHVRAREFEYVNGTLQNQVAFLAQLQRGFAGVDMDMEITNDDFAEIVWSHCSDVPSVLLNQASFHLTETPEGAVTATLRSFVTALSACLVYNDFLSKVHEVYSELMQASRDVHFSSLRASGRSESTASAMAADRVVARLRLMTQQAAVTTPPLGVVESFVFKSASFQEFCGLFFSSPAIAATIGELHDAFPTLSR